MQLTIEYERLWNWRRMTAKAIAPVIAILIMLLFLVGPMLLFRVSMGIPLDGEGPRGELWLLVLGIGLGNVAAHRGFSSILARFGGFTKDQIRAMWRDEER
jgi:hypothetical protein